MQFVRRSAVSINGALTRIGINQDDYLERELQVQQMGDIYASSQRTIVWFGEETSSVRGWVRAVKTISASLPLRADGRSPKSVAELKEFDIELLQEFGRKETLSYLQRRASILSDPAWKTIAALLRHAWFTRKWVIQEVVEAKEILMTCGHRSLPWDLWDVILVVVPSSGLVSNLPFFREDPITFSAFTNCMRISGIRISKQWGKYLPLHQLLSIMPYFSCSDPRDHIFALVGISSDASSRHTQNCNAEFKPDYSPKITAGLIFRRFTLWCMSELGSIDFLSLGQNPIRNGNTSQPSWVPDLTIGCHQLEARDDYVNSGSFQASLGSIFKFRVSEGLSALTLSGKTIDVVQELGDCFPGTNGDGQLINTLKCLEQCLNMAVRIGWDETRGQEDQQTTLRYLQTCRTLLWNMHAPWTRTTANTATHTPAQGLYEMYQALKAFISGGELRDFEFTISRLRDIDMLLPNRTTDRRFGVTKNGHLGSFPDIAKPGDKVCAFYGGKVLYVIRPRDKGSYTYIGDCYLDEFMNGEVMSRDDLPTEEFTLRQVEIDCLFSIDITFSGDSAAGVPSKAHLPE
jgi:hypothetical protein